MEEREIPFDAYLLSWLHNDIKPYLLKQGVLDKQGNLDKEFFSKKLEEERKAKIIVGMNTVVDLSPSIATAHEYLGDMRNALDYYWVGTHCYTDPWPVFPGHEGEMIIEQRYAYAHPQLTAAICNDRIGNRGHASQLFEWAAAHLTVTDDEKDQFRREGYCNMVWEYTIDRAFCLLCLERWEEALAAAEEAERWVKMDTDRYEKFGRQYTPFHLLPVYLALARYRAHPSPEREKEAKKRLMLSEFKVKVNHLRHGALLYIFELWARNLDLLK